jgi:hypothetical protein
VCAFHFADVYFFKRKLAALLNSTTLNTTVDTLLANETELEAYFRIALYAAKFLVEELDPRTFKGKQHRLAVFPDRLTPQKPILAPLNESQLFGMSKYKSA